MVFFGPPPEGATTVNLSEETPNDDIITIEPDTEEIALLVFNVNDPPAKPGLKVPKFRLLTTLTDCENKFGDNTSENSKYKKILL